MEKDKIELKALMDPAEVAGYLEALAKGFKAGRISVEKDGDELCLCPEPGAKAEVEVEARVKKGKAKFSLELSWRLPLADGEAASALTISSEDKQPVAKPEAKPEEKKAAPKPEAKKPEEKKAEQPAAKPAAAPAPKSDVKPAGPAVNEPGVKAPVAAATPPKPKQ
jgi:amphi-Trp domain-containing protein